MKKTIYISILLSCILLSGFSHDCGMQPTAKAAASADEHLIRTYYVNASLGNDLNNGRSKTQAWRTLERIRTQSLKPGDTVLLKRGELWREHLALDKSSGSPDMPITIGAYGSGKKPQINGAHIKRGWSRHSGAIYQKSFAHAAKVIVQGNKLLTYLIWKNSVQATFAGASPGSFSCDDKTKTAYVWCTDNTDPDTHIMEVAAMSRNDTHEYGIRIRNISNIVVQDIEIVNTTHSGIRVQPTVGHDTNNITLRRLLIRNTGSKGIEVINGPNSNSGLNEIKGLLIASCKIYDTNYHGIILSYGVSGAVVRNNTTFRTGWSLDGSHGITSWSNKPKSYVHDCIIEGNTAYECRARASTGAEGAGIQADDLTKDCIYRNNISYNNEGSGFYFNGTSGCKYYYNISYGNGTSLVSKGKFRGGLTLSQPIDIEVYNNVLFNNDPCGIGWWGRTTNGLTIKNNIIVKNGVYEIRSGVDAGRNVRCDYNCIYHPVGGIYLRWLGSDAGWTKWKNIPGQHNHSLRASPRFVDAANGNFNLHTESSCIDRGTDVGLEKDINGIDVPQGQGVDIGANENPVQNHNSSLKGKHPITG
ncbi:right-handed parallel beta-helix repeat-containing protein [Acidobacteriota bacterium]